MNLRARRTPDTSSAPASSANSAAVPVSPVFGSYFGAGAGAAGSSCASATVTISTAANIINLLNYASLRNRWSPSEAGPRPGACLVVSKRDHA
jgi:hypothetical protein